jgi:hypothetical protein
MARWAIFPSAGTDSNGDNRTGTICGRQQVLLHRTIRRDHKHCKFILITHATHPEDYEA